jgi:CheY-like chemotaxis protein
VVAVTNRSRVDASPSFALLSDQPHGDGDDPLNFERVAADLMQLILASRERTPFTVGIKGDWGAGKSSLMRRLERQLDAREEVVSVWFNAWTSERGDTLEGLIKSVLAKVDTNILRRYARNEKVITGARVFTTLAAGPLRLGNVVDALWERASIDPKARNELRKLISETMDEWVAKTPTGSDKRLLVVFVDDLDRCSPDAVFQVFEAIKLYLDARGFVFVIGFDETIVSEAILEQKKFSKSVTSQLYLDKIVQIEYPVPVPEEKTLRTLLDGLAAASGTTTLLDNSARSLIVQRSDRNPRRLKRFINAFVLEHALKPEAAGVDPQILIRELILRTYFQTFVRLYARDGDPLEEFSTYLAIRTATREGSGEATAEFRRFFADNKAPLVDGQRIDGAALAELENKLPEPYTELAQNENFISLVEYLRKSGTDTVRSRLETAPEVTAPADPAAWQSSDSPEALRGVRILWVDDNPTGNQSIVDALRREGCAVETVESSSAAEARLAASGQPVDFIVSDIAREGDGNAGLTALRQWRSKELYVGPVVFYAARITPERRKEASSLGATVTNDPGELLQQIRASTGPSKAASVA